MMNTTATTVSVPAMFIPYVLDALAAAVKDSTEKRNAAHFACEWDTADYYKGQLTYYCEAYNAIVDVFEQS